jgi:hypothetical protein
MHQYINSGRDGPLPLLASVSKKRVGILWKI